MIIATPSYPSKNALKSLASILQNNHYFLDHTLCRISSNLAPQIDQALDEINELLIPASYERINQIISRLLLHFPSSIALHPSRIKADYIAMLQPFPEDLICASYQHVLMHHESPCLPKIADLLIFMEPEMACRQTIQRKLHILRQQATKENIQ